MFGRSLFLSPGQNILNRLIKNWLLFWKLTTNERSLIFAHEISVPLCMIIFLHDHSSFTLSCEFCEHLSHAELPCDFVTLTTDLTLLKSFILMYEFFYYYISILSFYNSNKWFITVIFHEHLNFEDLVLNVICLFWKY